MATHLLAASIRTILGSLFFQIVRFYNLAVSVHGKGLCDFLLLTWIFYAAILLLISFLDRKRTVRQAAQQATTPHRHRRGQSSEFPPGMQIDKVQRRWAREGV